MKEKEVSIETEHLVGSSGILLCENEVVCRFSLFVHRLQPSGERSG